MREHLTRELAEAADEAAPDALPLQKLAFEVAVRINTVTPITPPSLITMALLWADRALSGRSAARAARSAAASTSTGAAFP